MELKELEDAPIVNEFLEALPVDLLGLPSNRKMESVINLIHGTEPIRLPPDREIKFVMILGTESIYQARYRMVLAELKKFKVLLKEIFDK